MAFAEDLAGEIVGGAETAQYGEYFAVVEYPSPGVIEFLVDSGSETCEHLVAQCVRDIPELVADLPHVAVYEHLLFLGKSHRAVWRGSRDMVVRFRRDLRSATQ